MEKLKKDPESSKGQPDASLTFKDFYPIQLNFIFDLDDLLDRESKLESYHAKEEE